MKKVFLIIIPVLFVMFSCHENGTFYPKVVFSLVKSKDSPPSSADKRLKTKGEYPEELSILLQNVMNDFKVTLNIDVYVKKPYKMLNIKEIRYSTLDVSGLLFENLTYSLPEKIMYLDKPTEHWSYITIDDEYYWCWVEDLKGLLKTHAKIDLFKKFQGKRFEIGDKFEVDFFIEYSFDDEPSKTLNLKYDARVLEGWYSSPFNI